MNEFKCTYLGNNGIWAEYEIEEPYGELSDLVYPDINSSQNTPDSLRAEKILK